MSLTGFARAEWGVVARPGRARRRRAAGSRREAELLVADRPAELASLGLQLLDGGVSVVAQRGGASWWLSSLAGWAACSTGGKAKISHPFQPRRTGARACLGRLRLPLRAQRRAPGGRVAPPMPPFAVRSSASHDLIADVLVDVAVPVAELRWRYSRPTRRAGFDPPQAT